ncbi:response regulator transcription factor [Paenibacillus marinisediminis]
MKHILIVEDDKDLNEGIKLILDHADTTVAQAYNIKSAEGLLKNNKFDLILLDVNLPDGNGFELCKDIRQTSSVPIIFLTAEDMELNIVRGLEMGGDDYITKPFSLMVLRARVKAVLRRHSSSQANTIIIGDLAIDFDNMMFTRKERKITLSKIEQKLLKILVVNRGNIISRERLVDLVWDHESEDVDEHALTVSIKRLRSKLEEDPSQPQYIKNVYGIGYTWVKEEINEA